MTSSPAAWAAARVLGSIGPGTAKVTCTPRAASRGASVETACGAVRRTRAPSRAPVATWVTGSASSGRATSDHASSVQSPTYSDATHNSGASDRSTSSLHRGSGRIRPRAAAVTTAGSSPVTAAAVIGSCARWVSTARRRSAGVSASVSRPSRCIDRLWTRMCPIEHP